MLVTAGCLHSCRERPGWGAGEPLPRKQHTNAQSVENFSREATTGNPIWRRIIRIAYILIPVRRWLMRLHHVTRNFSARQTSTATPIVYISKISPTNAPCAATDLRGEILWEGKQAKFEAMVTFADFFACPDIQTMVAPSDSSLDFVRDRQFLQDGPSVITQSAVDNTPQECRQHQHFLHRILTTTTSPRCQVAQQTCHLHINHNECCRRYAAYDFWLRRCYFYLNRDWELISGNFHWSETYGAMTKMEIGKETLGGCVLIWVPVSSWNDF